MFRLKESSPTLSDTGSLKMVGLSGRVDANISFINQSEEYKYAVLDVEMASTVGCGICEAR
jgi:hypothetical protein